MAQFDGRKRTAMYFGQASPGCLLPWYSEIKRQLALDGFTVTHLALGTKSKFGRISQAKRTKKRYTEAIKKDPDEVISFDVYCIEEDVTHLSTRYLIHMMLPYKQSGEKEPALRGACVRFLRNGQGRYTEIYEHHEKLHRVG